MTTVLSTSTHGIAHHGQMYVATLKTGCVLSTNADELIRTIKQHEEQNIKRCLVMLSHGHSYVRITPQPITHG